jgi:hypothetical protein
MATTAPNTLSDKAKAVLDYHRKVPNNEPHFASCLIETPCLTLDELAAAYTELLKAGELVAVGKAPAFDRRTGQTLGYKSMYRVPQEKAGVI